MGIDITGLNAILKMLQHCKNKKQCLTLGRQECMNTDKLVEVASFKKMNIPKEVLKGYSEPLLTTLGFESVDSIDYSDYEKASILFDMNRPLSNELLAKKYDCVIDCGTIEHIFNIGQVFQNIIDFLDKDGIFLSVNVNNNFSGHGFWQFSPEVYMRVFQEKYGMELLELYLAETDTLETKWIPLKDSKECFTFRNNTSFHTLRPVYIIAIAKKVSTTGQRLLENYPQQFSYEGNDWVK
jgi:hypothetical protein